MCLGYPSEKHFLKNTFVGQVKMYVFSMKYLIIYFALLYVASFFIFGK